jgi:DNA repair exonuclease SbcCD ATPase subunit
MPEFDDDAVFEDDKGNKLELIVRDSGLEKTKADVILSKFQNFFELASDWERKAKTIRVTSEDQVDDMKMARTGRLLLREKRLDIEKSRKELKEQALREGKAIDGIANVLKALIVPIEEYLEKQEKFIEFKKAAEEEAKRIEIEKRMQEEEQKRIAEEAARQEAIRLENERLKKEAVERERQAAAERVEAERKLEAERARSRAEAAAIEEKARQERIAAEKKAAESKAKADHERKVVEEKARIEREKQEAEIARLKSQLTCPKCGHKFNPTERTV